MTDAIRQMAKETGFEQYMNLPEWDGIAKIRELPDGTHWIVCPYCGLKLIKVLPETKIHMMPYKCKGSHCKGEFIVNVK